MQKTMLSSGRVLMQGIRSDAIGEQRSDAGNKILKKDEHGKLAPKVNSRILVTYGIESNQFYGECAQDKDKSETTFIWQQFIKKEEEPKKEQELRKEHGKKKNVKGEEVQEKG